MPITLVVRSGETAIAAPAPPSITFDLPRVVIGRSDGCDLRLPDLSVSQRHATIRQRGSEYIVVDEGSSNGTFIGPVRLHPQSPRIVRSRELIRVGRIWIEVRIEPVAPTNQANLATRELALALVARALDDQGEPARPRLFVSVGPDCTKSLDLSDNLRPFVLGRGRDTDLTLDLPEASRRHAQVTRKGDVLLVRDLGSRQGTHGEQGPLPADRDTPMRVGESFIIGSDRFVFEYPAVEALKELERASDEPLAAGDVPPAPSSNDDAADPIDLQGTDLSPALPSASASPPPSHLPSPSRTPRKPSRSAWSKTDFAVVLLALIVLGLSAVGLLWLFRGS